jgi:hypothetical protein
MHARCFLWAIPPLFAAATARIEPGAARASPLDALLFNTSLGAGGTVTALANVTDVAACCDLCHNRYHGECAGFTYGPSPALASNFIAYPSHNCAIMAVNGPAKPVENHVSAIVKHTPSPAPPAHGNPCRADLDCNPAVATEPHWRCGKAALPVAPENNCHLPGPGTPGNSTCACGVDTCGGALPPANT